MMKAAAMWSGLCGVLVVACMLTPWSPLYAAQDDSRDSHVLEAFTQQQEIEGEAVKISDEEKQRILFIMGATLLLLLLSTAGVGVAMGVYGKQVFVVHMVLAALSVTLAIAHSVAAVVWFFPF